MNDKAETRGLTILGSTGSIGTQALEVVDAHPDRLRVVAITAHSNVEMLEEQARLYRPSLVGMVSEAAAAELRTRLRRALCADAFPVAGRIVCRAVFGKTGRAWRQAGASRCPE